MKFLELLIYIVFFSFIGLAGFNVINQFFELNEKLYKYKQLKLNFLEFEQDFINLYEGKYTFFTWWNKLVLSWTNWDLIWYICSWNIQKVKFDSTWNVITVVNKWDYLKCLSLSWYYQTGINLDIKLKFLWTWLDLHYYFK